ncbi:MAG TPA: DUF4347 domain-containing protein, partial [Candidatus Acidoferrum sp.]|nr:DUF4347 domain-containing protein [Candidatus Acidoferrum sp.]
MGRRARKAAQRSRRFFLEPLESRLLLSADLPASLLPTPLIASVPSSPSAILDQLIPATQPHRQEMVVIDANVPDYQQLVKDVCGENGGNRQFDVVVLDPHRDGIQQITDALAGHKGLEALHILSHGADGTVQLGSTWLNTQDLSAYASAIAGWKSSFADDANVLLYGCDVAEHEDGRAFINALAFLTGVAVAASDDPTGASQLGGDWNLEVRTGPIETTTLLSTVKQDSWEHVLGHVESVNTWSPTVQGSWQVKDL